MRPEGQTGVDHGQAVEHWPQERRPRAGAQTFTNDFKQFGSAMTKVKDRNVDKSYEVYLALRCSGRSS